MTVECWLGAFDETIEGAGFRNTSAASCANYLRRYGAAVGSLVDARRKADHELVILDILTGAPQRPFYPIRRTERIGILFPGEHSPSLVFMLRDDFPDTEHQQVVPEGFPAAICIDDRPWAEARLTWTPAELIDRVLNWFRRASRGELHDAQQPVDPMLLSSELQFLIPRSVLEQSNPQDLIAEHDPKERMILRVRRASSGARTSSAESFCLVSYRVPPERMKRLRFAPDNLAGLAAILRERGINLFDDLKALFRGWLAEGEAAAWRINSRFAVILEMPIMSPNGAQQDGLDHRAFITAISAGDIAAALGIAETSLGHGKVGYVRRIGQAIPDDAALAAIVAQTAEVHLEFEPDVAARLAGRPGPDERKVALIGAGTIGSHTADSLAREGRFTWTVIDDDWLLPHNLARHTALNDRVTQRKAKFLADHINGIFEGPTRAAGIPANLFAAGEEGLAIETALATADLIIDATASVVAARYLSDHRSTARRASIFFNPTGEAAVLLAEPKDRVVTLRDLEAQYFGLLLRTERLSEHLRPGETIAYTGACRAITNRIPQSRAAILSGVAALGLGTVLDGDEATISVWTLSRAGDVSADTPVVEPVIRFRTGGWNMVIDAGLVQRVRQMRSERLPSETGGILFGLVDIPAKHIHIVDASLAPPDSEERSMGFVRGVVGVDELMERVTQRTAGQVRYVGEWHSHPPRASARPSAVDGQQIDWLAALMGIESMPALMLIVAEGELAVIFADNEAVRLPQRNAA
jgi:hypothetical protein